MKNIKADNATKSPADDKAEPPAPDTAKLLTQDRKIPGVYLEAVILYVIIFFAGSAALFVNVIPVPVYAEEPFQLAAEIARIFTYSLPALVLVWYLMLRAKKLREWSIKPGRKDLISGIIALPCLLITGFTIAFISPLISGENAAMTLRIPSNAIQWIVLCISCFLAAYLEESFFRLYLLSRRKEMKLKASWALVVSVALFSICHIYAGPWGFLNAVISGTLLSFLYLRYKSLHGIAVAHALYNIVVYTLSAMTA